MNKFIFIASVFSVSLAQADCLDLVKNTLSTQDTLIVDPTLKRTQKELDSIKIKKKQAELTAKLIYNRPDVFEIGEDFDILAQESGVDFTHVVDYTKGPMQLRTFENKKTGKTVGLRLSSGKKMTVFPLKECQPTEFTLVDGGGRCFFKKSDCQTIGTITPEKFKAKCSFMNDTSPQTLKLVTSSCQTLEKFHETAGTATPAASQKENSPKKGNR